MNILGKLWLVFALIGTIAAFLNPYIGFFGFFNVTELFILVCFWINIIVREKKLKNNPENRLKKIGIKSFGFAIYFVATMFFIMKTLVALGLFKISYGSNNIMTPYEIWSNPSEISIVFLVIEMVFNVLLLVSLICKATYIRRGCGE